MGGIDDLMGLFQSKWFCVSLARGQGLLVPGKAPWVSLGIPAKPVRFCPGHQLKHSLICAWQGRTEMRAIQQELSEHRRSKVFKPRTQSFWFSVFSTYWNSGLWHRYPNMEKKCTPEGKRQLLQMSGEAPPWVSVRVWSGLRYVLKNK